MTAPLGVVTVTQGLRYRIRLINIVSFGIIALRCQLSADLASSLQACDPNYVFSIDGHTNLTIIEADGITTTPYSVDSIQIYVGMCSTVSVNT